MTFFTLATPALNLPDLRKLVYLGPSKYILASQTSGHLTLSFRTGL